jgi:ABC-type polysaccharide/polyol phosphate transport system ATPase subunit
LLRVLNGVYPISAGRLEVNGSCQALLNMSLGFNGEATVRENIFLRGTAMRLKASDMRDRIEPILSFAGLQEKSSHRLRTLSSGQKMRLGFSISTSVQHDIILMDEWVGAGDADFLAKATARMQDRVKGSKIVVLASHSVGLLRAICNKGIVLEQGRVIHAGDIVSSLRRYHELMSSLRANGDQIQAGMEPQGALVYGCAEEISLEDGGIVRLRGWITSTDASVPGGLAIEVEGARYPAVEIVRNKRPDVMRHFGLRDAQCGFVASFSVPRLASLADLGHGFRVLGGVTDVVARTPLRIAPGVSAAVRGED